MRWLLRSPTAASMCRWWWAVWNASTRTAATARSLPTPSSPSALTTAHRDAARLVLPPSSRLTADHGAGTAVQMHRGARHRGACIGSQEAHMEVDVRRPRGRAGTLACLVACAPTSPLPLPWWTALLGTQRAALSVETGECAMDLTGKTALVTGGSGAIGGVIARALAAAGADVALSYVGHLTGAAATADAVRAAGRRSVTVQLDQRDPVSIHSAVEQVVKACGRVDILVNNAAWNIGIPFKDLDALTAELWDRVLETNLRGPYLLARALAPELRRHKTGRIINIASVAGIAPGGSSIAYASSKAALIHLTRCLAVALAP